MKTHRPVHPEYFVDDIAKQAGHEVVHLPVAHYELNPIEMAWLQMKHYIKTHNMKFTLSEMERLIHIGFTTVTADRWKSLLAHVKQNVEDHYWETGGLQMEVVEDFVISTEGDSESEEDSSSSDYSD